MITQGLKQWMVQMWSEKVLTSTNEQMSRCSLPQHTFILSPVAEACPVCLYVLSGWLRRLWARSVVFPPHWHGLGHVWWLIEHKITCLHSARKPWNCQPPFLLCSWAETDSGGQTDDLLDLNTLNLTNPCWQPAELSITSFWKWEVAYFSVLLFLLPSCEKQLENLVCESEKRLFAYWKLKGWKWLSL